MQGNTPPTGVPYQQPPQPPGGPGTPYQQPPQPPGGAPGSPYGPGGQYSQGAPPQSPPPTKSGPAWGKIFGCGCGGCLVLLLVIGGLTAVLFATVLKKTPLPASQSAYVGTWSGDDGSTLVIESGGAANYKSGGGGSSTEITNGSITIDESANTLKVDLFGISKQWSITEKPTSGGDRMVLDKTTFTRGAGAHYEGGTPGGNPAGNTPPPPDGNSPPSNSPGTNGAANTPPPPPDSGGSGATYTDGSIPSMPVFFTDDAPSESDAHKMALVTLLKFNQSVKAADFNDFYNGISSTWQQQTTADQLRITFQDFIDKKLDLSPITRVTPSLDQPPFKDGSGLLHIDGRYPTSPSQVHYELKFIWEGGTWKLFGIKVNVG